MDLRAGAGLVQSDVTAYLCAGTMDMLHDLEANGFECQLRQPGAITIACDMAQAWHLAKEFADLKRRGMNVHGRASCVNYNATIFYYFFWSFF